MIPVQKSAYLPFIISRRQEDSFLLAPSPPHEPGSGIWHACEMPSALSSVGGRNSILLPEHEFHAGSTRTHAEVVGLEILPIDGHRRLQRFAADLPFGVLIGVPVAVLNKQLMQEFEHVAWNS